MKKMPTANESLVDKLTEDVASKGIKEPVVIDFNSIPNFVKDREISMTRKHNIIHQLECVKVNIMEAQAKNNVSELRARTSMEFIDLALTELNKED